MNSFNLFLLSWTLSLEGAFSINLKSSEVFILDSFLCVSKVFSSSIVVLKLGFISSASLVKENVNSTGLSSTNVFWKKERLKYFCSPIKQRDDFYQ